MLFDKVLSRSAIHMASLPASHPLHAPANRAASRFVKKHCSPLHHVFHHAGIMPNKMERITLFRRAPSYIPAFSTSIAKSKDFALVAAKREFTSLPISVFSDGSGFEDGIGASAVLYVGCQEHAALMYHLGPAALHTVYKAEIVGLALALTLLLALSRALNKRTIIGTDNQAAILALRNQCSHPTHYLLDHVHSLAEQLHKKQHKQAARGRENSDDNWTQAHTHNVVDLHISCTLGHVGFQPNKRANELAKEAAQGLSSDAKSLPQFLRRKPLPHSISASRQTAFKRICDRWAALWKTSPQFKLANWIDKKLPSTAFMKLLEQLKRREGALITQLRTEHSPLAHHLFRIRKAESPICLNCDEFAVETTQHYLLECPQFAHERQIHLRRPLRRDTNSIPFLFSTKLGVKHTARYISTTKRFAPST